MNSKVHVRCWGSRAWNNQATGTRHIRTKLENLGLLEHYFASNPDELWIFQYPTSALPRSNWLLIVPMCEEEEIATTVYILMGYNEDATEMGSQDNRSGSTLVMIKYPI